MKITAITWSIGQEKVRSCAHGCLEENKQNSPPPSTSFPFLLFPSPVTIITSQYHQHAHKRSNLTILTDKMEFNAIFKIAPYPKIPSLGDPVIFLPIWAFLFIVCLCTKLATALWPSVLSYLSFVVAFAPDKNFAVAAVSWLSFLRYWKPWAAATAGLRHEVDLAIDFIFLAWFLMAFPVIVLTIWVGLKGVLLTANDIVRRIHVAVEFEFDLTEYVVKCYLPMEPGSPGDCAMAQLLAASGNCNFTLEFLSSRPILGLSKAGYDIIFRGKRPRRFTVRSFTAEELRDQARLKRFVKERCAQILAARKGERIAAEQLEHPKPTPFDSELVPQSRETPTPVVQSSAWPTVPESDNVAEDVTTASEPIETEEPADQKGSKGEGLVGPGPKAPEPEVSLEAEGNGILEGVEDSKAQEPESSAEEEGESFAEEPKSSLEEEGEGPLYMDSKAQEPESSVGEEGEGSLSEVDPANDPEISFEVEGEATSSAMVPEAAQELETSFDEEGDGLLNIDAAPTEEPEVSIEAEGEDWTTLVSLAVNETSFEEEFDAEMADVEPLAGMVPGPLFTSGYFNSQVSILPLEVVGPWSSAGQEPGYHYDTRGWMDLSPVVESAQAVVEAQ